MYLFYDVICYSSLTSTMLKTIQCNNIIQSVTLNLSRHDKMHDCIWYWLDDHRLVQYTNLCFEPKCTWWGNYDGETIQTLHFNWTLIDANFFSLIIDYCNGWLNLNNTFWEDIRVRNAMVATGHNFAIGSDSITGYAWSTPIEKCTINKWTNQLL